MLPLRPGARQRNNPVASVTSPSERMAGPGGVRHLAARWVIHADLVAESAVHVGSGDRGDLVDLELLRAHDGRPLLPGTTLAGGLRDRLCDVLLGDRRPERGDQDEALITALFGGRRGDPDGPQSPVIVKDAVGTADVVAEVRDGVRLDPETGVAGDHAKYDLELWPPGTRFRVRLHLLAPETPPPGMAEADLLAGLLVAADGFASGDIRLGARGTRGLGRCRLENVCARRYALGADGRAWLQWLATGVGGRGEVFEKTPSAPTLAEALVEAFRRGSSPQDENQVVSKLEVLRRRTTEVSPRLTLVVPVRFRGGVLIGSPSGSASGADVRHLRSGTRPVLSGSAKGGALRQRARRVARAVRAHYADAEAWVVQAFGSEAPQGPGRRDSGRTGLSTSRLLVEEDVLRGGHDLQVTRVAIDRFTQGPIPGALFQEEPVYGASADLRFTLRLPAEPQLADALCGFLLLVIKDLLLGEVPLGGTVGVGRGALRPAGPLRVTWREWSEYAVDLSNPPKDFRKTADSWVQTFHEYSASAAGAPTAGGSR